MLQTISKTQSELSLSREGMRAMTTRYSKICSEFDQHYYHVFGCGAIGSSAAVCLSKHNAKNFYLYDNDTVSLENIGISAYSKSDIGETKVFALTSI